MASKEDEQSEFARLAEGILRGDQDATREFFEKYTKRFIRHLIYAWYCSPHTAEDLTNETMMEILREIRKEMAEGRTREKKTAWGFRILEHNALDYRAKRKKNERDRSLDEMNDMGTDVRDERSETPSAKVILKENQAEISRAKKIWEEEYQKVHGETRRLLDLLRSGLSVAQIAERTGKNYHTCHTLMKRAQDRLSEIVQARLAGKALPQPRLLSRPLLALAIIDIPADLATVARMICIGGLQPEAIVAAAGTNREKVEADLGRLWIWLSSAFRRDFPEALADLDWRPG